MLQLGLSRLVSVVLQQKIIFYLFSTLVEDVEVSAFRCFDVHRRHTKCSPSDCDPNFSLISVFHDYILLGQTQRRGVITVTLPGKVEGIKPPEPMEVRGELYSICVWNP